MIKLIDIVQPRLSEHCGEYNSVYEIRKQDGKVWLKKGELAPAVCRSDFRAPKVLYCIFSDGLGPVAQVPVLKGQTLTAQFYASVVLPEVEKSYCMLSAVQILVLVASKFYTIMPKTKN